MITGDDSEQANDLVPRKIQIGDESATWPAPGKRLDDLEWILRYSLRDKPIPLSMQDRLVIASALHAYERLINLPKRKRDAVIRELRKGPNL